MAFKFIAFFALCIAAANAGVIAPAAPFAAVAPAPLAVAARIEEYDPHPQYTYGYDVKDALSGDSKTAVETRDGDIVQGQYSLNDADGYRRIVDYTSDSINGFNAVVRREPLVAPAPVIAPFVRAAALAAPAPLVAGPAVLRTEFASPLISYAY
ncbi:larval cuticle protein A2B-like [Rhagoletis pomonella]|uniref:larval cuticle protein A2B-like n=1 Tax=Rhagoletis pomonella TaxID=28610 RepID=UPI00178189EE|nr:larval cuticle protein A2B-like [Rhagoletis pomonella]